jgi:tetratricopeptide (TPR) repeat protein
VLAGGVSAAGWFLVDAEHKWQQIEQSGREAYAWEKKGIDCWNRDDWAGAASAYRQCLKMEHNPHVQYELSQALEAQGKLDEAEEAGRAAVDGYQVDSDGPYVDSMKSIAATYANQLGDVLWAKKEYGPALNAYARAAAFTPKDAEFQRNIALKNYTLKRYPTAYQHALQATQLDDNSADNWRTLGDVLAAESRFVESAKAYKNATLLDPKDKEAWKGLATALEKQGRHKEAKEAAMRL